MFSTLPVMINDFSLCDIIIVLIYVLYKKCTCRVPFIIESISRMLPCTNHLILIFKNTIIWSNCNDFKTFKDLKINNKWKGAGRSPANPGFGPLVRFWYRTIRACCVVLNIRRAFPLKNGWKYTFLEKMKNSISRGLQSKIRY